MRQLGLALAISVAALIANSAANDIDWHEYYEHAREEAQRTGKPMLIAFRCAP